VAESKRYFRPVLSLLLLAATALGLYNVYGDNSEVQSMAKQVACGGHECQTQLTRVERTPIGQSYDLVAGQKGPSGPSTTVTVSCRRAYFLVGAWSCQADR
jgi:hypothetical protein